MAGLAIITEACIDVKDRACVDVCPVQCIYEFDPQQNVLFSEDEAGSGTIETTHAADPDAIAVFGDSILYVNLEECTSCTAPKSTSPMDRRQARGTTRTIPTRGTTTHFSCSTAATCSRTNSTRGAQNDATARPRSAYRTGVL